MNIKRGLFIMLGVWLLWISTWFFISIKLNGDANVLLKIGQPYYEYGASGSFFSNSLQLKVNGNVDTTIKGKYKITYEAKNLFFIKRKKVRTITVVDGTSPILKLKGNMIEIIRVNDPYIEAGYSAVDNIDGDLSSKVQVISNVDTKKEGVYNITYKVTDSSNNETTVKRIVQVNTDILQYKNSYNDIDNTKNGWWSGNKFDHIRPSGGADINELKKYNAFFVGNDEKIIYLTFDEGSNDTYLDEIADILKNNNVNATFFLCGNYMKENKELVKKWVSQGHSIGNHTYHHRSTPEYATRNRFNEFQKEIIDMENLYYDITGKAMDKIYRDPKGQWSFRGLQMVKDLGYKSFFWSADYLDYDQTYDENYAYNQLIKRYHNGAIYLLHPKQKGTYLALDKFIKEIKSLGYNFGLVKDIF